MEDKNNISTYSIYENTNEEVSFFCEQVESNNLSSTIGDTTKNGSKSSKVNSCERTASNALSSTIDNTDEKGSMIRVQKSALASTNVLYGSQH